MLDRFETMLREACSFTSGSGISSTKLVWLSNGMSACYCATLATLGGVSAYLFQGHADAIYWSAVTALWTISVGFATSAKKNQTSATKEITLANQSATSTGTKNEGGEA